MKIFRYILLLLGVIIFGGCKSSVYNELKYPQEKSYIALSARPEFEVDLEVKGSGVVDATSKFGSDKVALYAVKYVVGTSAPFDFSLSNRVINVEDAYVDAKGSVIYGEKVEFPDTKVAAYGLFPSEAKNGVTISEVGGSSAPQADVVLKTKASEQYDVMLAKNEDLKRENHAAGKSDEMKFSHSLAQLKIKMYADANVAGDKRVTKVEVVAPKVAKLADIRVADYTVSTLESDLDTFTLYDDAGGVVVDKTSKDEAIVIPGVLMLFPGEIKHILLTIDGSVFQLDIPSGKKLLQGAENAMILQLKQTKVVFGDITIGKWGVGSEGNGEADYFRYRTNLAVSLMDKQGEYVSSASKFSAQVQINGNYWLAYSAEAGSKPVKDIPCVYENGVLKFKELVETKMGSDAPISLSAIKIFADGTLVYDVVATANKLGGGSLIVNQKSGKVSFGDVEVKFDLGFGGLGNGEASFPYIVESADLLSKIRDFYTGQDNTVQYHFKQICDIALTGNWTPLTADYPANIVYDGGENIISGLYINDLANSNRSLFGKVGVAGTRSVIKNLTLIGSIESAVNVGAFAGEADNTDFIRCVSKVDITYNGDVASAVGGLVGFVNKSCKFYQCGNDGKLTVLGRTLSGPKLNIGGVVGNIVEAGSVFEQVYNKGVIECGGATYVGGLVGSDVAQILVTVNDCYNKGEIKGAYNLRCAGLFARWFYNYAKIENCYNSGSMLLAVGQKDSDDGPILNPLSKSGAFVGEVPNSSSVKAINSYYLLGVGVEVAMNGRSDYNVGMTTEAKVIPTADNMNNGRVGNDVVWKAGGALGPIFVWEQ